MNISKAEEYLREAGIEGTLEEVETGNVSQTYRVGDDHYLQASNINPENLRRGMLALESQQETDIPVPEVIYSDLDEPVLVTRAVPGESIGQKDEEEAYRDAGRVMAEIHDQNFDSYGLMTVEDGEMVPSGGDNWANSLSTLYHRFISSGSELLEKSKAAEIDRFFYDNMPEVVEDPEKSMAHFDFHGDNLIHQEGEIHGVLDWDMVRVVDPALEVIRAQNQFRREDKPVEAFNEGYRSKRDIELNDPTERIYRVTAELGRLSELEFLERTQGSEPEEKDIQEAVDKIDRHIHPTDQIELKNF